MYNFLIVIVYLYDATCSIINNKYFILEYLLLALRISTSMGE